MIISEIVKNKYTLPSEEAKTKAKAEINKMRKEGEKLVKGMFEFTDAQGGWIDFTYRFFPGDPIIQMRINHGEICELPMLVIKHLNNVYKKVRVPSMVLGQPAVMTKTSRTRFTPMEAF